MSHPHRFGGGRPVPVAGIAFLGVAVLSACTSKANPDSHGEVTSGAGTSGAGTSGAGTSGAGTTSGGGLSAGGQSGSGGTATSVAWYNTLGSEAAALKFHANGDKTHTNLPGADKLASLVAGAIKTQNLALAKYLR